MTAVDLSPLAADLRMSPEALDRYLQSLRTDTTRPPDMSASDFLVLVGAFIAGFLVAVIFIA